jgi:type III secretion system low calcium response chaperone LcrH/SycD
MQPKDAMGFDDNFMEHLYSYAYRLFNSGRYDEARELFILLMRLDATKSRYPFALACCYQKMEKWQDAINAYIAAYVFNQKDPLPIYHVADCLIKLKCPQGAKLMLQSAIDLVNSLKSLSSTREHQALKQRAEMMIAAIDKEMQEEELQEKTSEQIEHAKNPSMLEEIMLPEALDNSEDIST